MSLINFTSAQDGTTAVASQVNAPLTTIYNEFNGNITAANLAANSVTTAKLADASVTNAKLATGAGEPGGAWTAWTPTYQNLTVGNGTVTAVYTRIGKTIHYKYKLVLGSTSAIGNVKISLPVVANNGSATNEIIGEAQFTDAGVASFFGTAFVDQISVASDALLIRVKRADAAYVQHTGISSTVPITWATNDILYVCGTYEAA